MPGQLFNDSNYHRGQQDLAGLTMYELYMIMKESLLVVANTYDTDSICQAACARVEKKLGIYPNIPGFEVDK